MSNATVDRVCNCSLAVFCAMAVAFGVALFLCAVASPFVW